MGGGHHRCNLTGISPARDKGDPDTSGIAEYDILGNPRICKGRIDIGAYEHLERYM